MAYQVNLGIGAVAGVKPFILDGLDANPGGGGGASTQRSAQSRGRNRARLWWLVFVLLQGWS
jgi:hypothetical protein